MSNQIHAAIKYLGSYKNSSTENQDERYDPFETKRREAYIKNVIRDLTNFLLKPSSEMLDLIIEDIDEVTQNNFYETKKVTTTPADRFTKVLNKTQSMIREYRAKRYIMENTRARINGYFSEFSNSIESLIKGIHGIISKIETELNGINPEKDALWQNGWTMYLNLSKKIRRCEIDIFNQPLNFEKKLESDDTRATTNHSPELLAISEIFLNIALNLRHYHNQLQQYLPMTSVQTIKSHSRHLCRVTCRLEKNIHKITHSKLTLQNKVVVLYSQSKFLEQHGLLKVINVVNSIFQTAETFLHETREFKKSTSLIFAYVLDESVLRIRRRNVLSRLDLLLSGNDFEPLDEVDIQHAYEENMNKTGMSIRQGYKKTSLINQKMPHLNA